MYFISKSNTANYADDATLHEYEKNLRQPPDAFYKKTGVLKHFTKFTGKHLYYSFFYLRPEAYNFHLSKICKQDQANIHTLE